MCHLLAVVSNKGHLLAVVLIMLGSTVWQWRLLIEPREISPQTISGGGLGLTPWENRSLFQWSGGDRAEQVLIIPGDLWLSTVVAYFMASRLAYTMAGYTMAAYMMSAYTVAAYTKVAYRLEPLKSGNSRAS